MSIENRIQSRDTLETSEIEQRDKESFKVYIPGITGGGKNITAIREYLHGRYGDNVYIPSSISHETGLKKGEKNSDEHYKNLVTEVTKRADKKDITVVAHSLGGFEVIDLLYALLASNEWQGYTVTINFLAAPGFGAEGMNNLIETGKRFHRLNQNVALSEQHIAYPLPEECYTRSTLTEEEEKATVLFHDTVKERTQRRNNFLNQWLEKIVPDAQKRGDVITKLHNIDHEILEKSISNQSIDILLHERAKVLNPLIQTLFRGEHIDEAVHQQFMKKYEELTENLAPAFNHYLNYTLYLARAGNYIFSGMEEKISEIAKEAQQKNKKVKIAFTIPGRDSMTKVFDIDLIEQTMQTKEIKDIFEGFYLLEQYGHSSIGYYPEILNKVFEAFPS